MAEMKKFQVVGNPKYLKRVEKALRDLTWVAKSKREITDYSGPDGHIVTELFSGAGPCEGFYPIWQKLGDTVNWEISRETQTRLLDELIPAAKADIYKVIPVEDNRTTPEQRAAEAEEMKRINAANEERAAKHAEAVNQAVADLLQTYPWAKTFSEEMAGKSTHAAAAEAARRLFAHHWPGIPVSVRSESFSGGNSMTIRWTLGPSRKEAEAVLGNLQRGRFDGMTDMYEDDHSAESDAWRKVFAQVKYMDCSRDDKEALGVVCDHLRERCKYDTERHLLEDAERILNNQSFPPGAVVTGIEEVPDPTNPGGVMTRCTFTVAQVTAAAPSAGGEPTTIGGVTVSRNMEHDGVEIRFAAKPIADVLAKLKGHGWRWSMRSKCWYKRYSEQAEAFAKSLAEELNHTRSQHELAGAAA